MNFLRKLIFEGQIPCCAQLKTLLYVLAWFMPFSIFVMPEAFESFGEIGFYVLIGVMAIRPLAMVFPQLGILRTLVLFRREFGIFCGMMVLAHFVGYFLAYDLSFGVLLTEFYWDVKGAFFWGLLGVIVAIPLLVTSNKKAMILLKKNWKRIQRLSYLFLFFGAVHVSLVGEASGFVGLILVALVWLLARFKVQFRWPSA